jgi:adenylate cyclase
MMAAMKTEPQEELPEPSHAADERWRAILAGDPSGTPGLRRIRGLFKHLPSDPRCKLCYAPYAAPFGPLLARLGFGRWDKNPSLCGSCLRIMERGQGGAEVELSLLFADLRGSTQLAAGMSPTEYGHVLNAFYAIAARAVQRPGGNVDKYLGDGVFALFIPGFAGQDHAARAVQAAREILAETESSPAIPAPLRPLPVGIGVHAGRAYVGVLGEAGHLTDFTAIGDAVNVTERLSSTAGARELIISEAAVAAAQLPLDGLTRRELTLKGVDRPVAAWSQTIGAAETAAQ